MRRAGGIVLTVTGFLACPCHLIITLPLLISLLAGTALGSFLSRNTGLVTTFAAMYFVVALALGASFLFGWARPRRSGDEVCSTCVPATSEKQGQESFAQPVDQASQQGEKRHDDLKARTL
jgi:mercuric ion transport protein